MVKLEYIEKIREQGYRPEVLIAFVHQKKILFVYKQEHNLWQLPQGGIEQGENLKEASIREMLEEMDSSLLKKAKKIIYLMQARLLLSKQVSVSRELKTKAGKLIPMKGKHYFCLVILTNESVLDIKKTDFDNFTWVNYSDSLNLLSTIYQYRKAFILRNFIKKMKLYKII